MIKEQFKQGGVFQERLLRYMEALLRQSTQTALCNRAHPTEERLSRWLLLVSHRVHALDFDLPEEFMAHMLGTYSFKVAEPIQALQKKGIIDYRDSHITIRDHAGLQQNACECAAVICNQYEYLLA